MQINEKQKWLLLKTVQDKNILPITSACNSSCVFCSHRQNPSSVKTYQFGHLEFDLIQELIEYLPKSGPVILGESATRIIEGEPFFHPDFEKILRLLRNKFKEKEIRISTSGSFLTKKKVNFLKTLEPIKLNISLNCASPEHRRDLMGDNRSEQVFAGLKHLKKYNLAFNGSVVAMPHFLGWESLPETVALLIKYAPRTIRIFLPGFTREAEDDLKFRKSLIYRLKKEINILNKKYQVPIIMEPPLLTDFNCEVKGIISGSPADKAGLEKFDIIKKINDYLPLTRVDAFNKLKNLQSPELVIKRKRDIHKISLEKKKKEKPGIVMDYDLSLSTVNNIEQKIIKSSSRKIIIVTSILAEDIFKKLVDKCKQEYSDKCIQLLMVRNKFFGGTIMCAGLLVNKDIISALRNVSYHQDDLLLLPGNMFDYYGKDLTGTSYKKIGEKGNINVEIIL